MKRFLFLVLALLASLSPGLIPSASAQAMSLPDVSKEAMGPRQDNPFYSREPFFAFRPVHNRSSSINRFGPVGIGIDLVQPAFTMKVRNVEPGSPAEMTGSIKKGQIIDTINGQKLTKIDPRIQLGDIIYNVQATDGKVTLVVRDTVDAPAKTVVVNIPVLGPYSPTWPLDCEKSNKIVSDLADYLRQKEEIALSHDAGPSLLFMVSTGEAKDLEVARRWVKHFHDDYKDKKQISAQNWTVGYMGIALCEYYLRTGDDKAIHVINLLADKARWDMYNDGWAHGTYRGNRDRRTAEMAFPYMGGGHINACGVHVVTFLLMAKECGAVVDEHTLQRSFGHFFRYACRGNVPYGDQVCEQSFVDNGKTGGLAFTMAAAESLSRSGPGSNFAKARDNSAVKGFYSTSWMNIGHTGGGVGEIWRSASMGMMIDKTPKKYREFMDNRRWFYELSRRFDGSIGVIGGGNRYDKHDSWGVMMGLSYTMPRKTLRLSGAPRTKYSKRYDLPQRPWGNAADDAFYSNTPAALPTGKLPDISGETFVTHSSRAIFAQMAPKDVDDQVLIQFAHHPDHGIRRGAANFINVHRRYHLIAELLTSKDPRVRHAGTMVMYCVFKRRPMKGEDISHEVAGMLSKMIKDENESVWVQINAMKALALTKPEWISPCVDRLLQLAKAECWWTAEASMAPLARIAMDPKLAPKILPVVADVMTGDTHISRSRACGKVFASLKGASPEVQQLAIKSLASAYANFPPHEELLGPDRIRMDGAAGYMLYLIGGDAAQFPGGANAIYAAAKKRYPATVLPHSSLFVNTNGKDLNQELIDAIERFKKTGDKPTRW